MSTRSRQGCDECRRRRRKCDEQKPCCGPCSAFNRTCRYTLRLVLGGARSRNGRRGRNPLRRASQLEEAPATLTDRDEETSAEQARTQLTLIPRTLPNGTPLPPRYQRLLGHFTQDILASLSCHPSIHRDLGQGLVPVMLESPQLMSACLALSAAGFLSRGVPFLDGVEISKILGHLQSSGLPLLRSALETGQMNETLLATCLIWCLTEVFTFRPGTSSWRVHLQGIRALLDGEGAHRGFLTAPSGAIQSAMKHLYQLYFSLRTLPYIPASEAPEPAAPLHLPATETPKPNLGPEPRPSIDGFLGYSSELLDIIHQIDHLSRRTPMDGAHQPPFEADLLLGRVQAMITRDSRSPPTISIHAPLSPEYGREFTLCHRIFQQATLLHLYRRLYRLPSRSPPVQAAVAAMQEMLGSMTHWQGRPCHTWVAMAMPLFNLGCEAYTEEQRRFALEKVEKLDECLRSFHVGTIRQALVEVWEMREGMGDGRGEVCASELLEKLDYNVVLF